MKTNIFSVIILTLLILLSNCKREYYELDPDEDQESQFFYPQAFPGMQGEKEQFVFNNDTIICEKINGNYVYQGDIILTEKQLLLTDTTTKGTGLPLYYYRWPYGIVYYEISQGFPDKSAILSAFEEYENKTSLRFVERTGQPNYVEFIPIESAEIGGYSSLGMIGGNQHIGLNKTTSTGTAIHEIGHTIGLIHEQSRSDRDSYVIINWQNIKSNYQSQFNKRSTQIKSSQYDFNSIMHYPCYSFCIDPLVPTITKLDGSVFRVQRKILSDIDVSTINEMYSNFVYSKPSVRTYTPTKDEITMTTAYIGGRWDSDGGVEITEKGIYWGSSKDPVRTGTKEILSVTNKLGSQRRQKVGLTPGTEYFVVAYAINAMGTGYGNEMSFRTDSPPPEDYVAKYSLTTPLIDGQVNTSEWANGNVYNITFSRLDNADTKTGTLYLQHDGTWLYVGVKTTVSAGWDVYLSLKFDGDNDNILNGKSTEPHTDINIEYPSPGGWSGYIRYDYLASETAFPTNPPTGTSTDSYGNTQVNYEYKIKLSDLNTSAGKTVGLYMFNLTDADPNHGYEFPINSVSTDPSNWAHILIQSFQPNGLVAYYPFNGNANDVSGNNNNGTRYGATPTNDRKGVPNSAYLFDGYNDYIEVNHSSSLNISQQISISLWLKFETSAPYYYPYHMIEKHGSWGIGQREFDIGCGVSTYNLFILDFEPDRFYHFVLTYNGTTLSAYVNGVLRESTVGGGAIPTTLNNLIIGKYTLAEGYYFDGTLDDIRIYNRALTQQEISALYNE